MTVDAEKPARSNMTFPLVSVVIPVYNGSRYMRQAINSVLAQTYKPLEIIAVNDGSTDDSAAIISSYGSSVHLVTQTNTGVAAARNAGVNTAQGQFVAFLDQDDWWLPEKVAEQVQLFLKDDEVGLVHTDVIHFDEVSGTVVGRFNPNRTDLLTGHCYERLLLGNAIFNSSTMVRKSVLEKTGPFDTGIAGNTIQDYDLWLRVAQSSALAYLPKPLAVYRLHPAQGMWNKRQSLVEELCLMERVVGEPGWLASPALRVRMASLLDEVGVAHLDAGAHVQARTCLARALRCRLSWRAWILLTLTLLPAGLCRVLRRTRARLYALSQTTNLQPIPPWASADKKSGLRLQ